MKTQTTRTILRTALLCGVIAFAASSRAADVVKADNADNLTATTSWVGGVVPTDADVALWDGTITAANTTILDVSTNWAGIRIASPVGTVTINSNTTVQPLGLGASGIDMSAATASLVINAPVSNILNQTWSVASGTSLTLNGALSGGGRLTKIGPGTMFVTALSGTYAGGYTIAEASVQTGNSGNASTMFGTNTMVLTNGGRVRFQSTSSSTFNVPLQVDAGGGILSYRGNSFYGAPPLSGTGQLTFQLDNNITITPTDFKNWTGTISAITTGAGGFFRQDTGFVNGSMTNISLSLGAGVRMTRRSATAATVVVEIGTLTGGAGSSVEGNGGGPTYRVGHRNEDSTFSGAIVGCPFTKTGSGTLTLTANSTHAGATTIQGGRLLCITGGSFSNSAVTIVTNGSVLGVQLASAGGQWAVSNMLFTLVPAATNTLAFDFVGFPASTATAPLLVRGGLTNEGPVNVSIKGGGWAVGTYPLISFSTSGGLGYSGFVLTNLPSGVLGYLTNDTATTLSLVVTNSALPLHWAVGDANWDLLGSLNWKDNNGATTSYQEASGVGYPVQLDDTASGTSPITVTLIANVAPSGVTVTNGSKNYILAGANAIGGGTPVTKLGSGTFTIQNNNTFTGGLNLNGGTVEFTANENLGASNSPVVFNGGTLRYATGASADFSTRTVTFAAGGATIDDNGNTVTLSRPIGNNGAGAFTKTGTGILTLSGTNRYNGPTTVANGTLTLAANTYISNTPAINLTGSGTLSGTLALSTPVNQLLYGTGTMAGDITAPASTRISPATNGVTGILTNNGNFNVTGGTLSMDLSTTARDEIVVSGTVTLTSGTLALNLGNTLTNGNYRLFQCGAVTAGSAANLTIVASGVAQPNKALALSEAIPNEINLVVSSFRGSNTVWVGDSLTNYWDVETSLNWTNLALGTAELFVSGDKVTFDDTGSISPDVNLQVAVVPGSVTVNSANNYNFSTTASGRISGATGLTKSGTGTLTINTENNNTGGTLVNGGILQVGNGGGGDLGTGPVTNNAVVVFNQGTDHTAQLISGTGHIQHQGPSQLTLLSNNTYAGSTAVGASSRLQVGNGGAAGTLGSGVVTNDGVLAFDRTGTFTVNNGITGAGALHKLGSGVMTLSGVNDYLNNTYISNGVVKLGASEVIPDGGSTTGWLILDGGATSAGQLDMNGFNESVNALSGVTGTVRGNITNSSASVTTTNKLTLNQNAATTYAGTISENPAGGKIALMINGSGPLTLPNDSAFSGGTTIMGGAVVNGTGGSPAGTGLITMSNATYHIAGNSGTFPGNNFLVLDGTIANLTAQSLSSGFGGYFNSTNAHDAIINVGANVSFSAADRKQFQGFYGLVEVITGGEIRWSSSSALTNGGDNALFRVTGLMHARNDGIISLGALEGGGLLDGTTTGGTSQYIIGLKGTNTTFSGTIGGTGGNANAIIKSGPATQTFSGPLFYSGNTTISNGVLAITGLAELTNTSTINLRQPGTLDVSGSASGGLELGKTVAQSLIGVGTNIGFVTVAANSAIRPAGTGGIGTLTISGALTTSGTITMDLNTTNAPTTNDLITAASVTASGGTLIVTNVGPDLTTSNYFKLFSTAVSGSFTTVSLPASNALNTVAYTWQNNLATDGSVLLLSAIGVPTVATNATNITFTAGGGNLTLSWPADHTGWTLQVQTNTRAVGLNTNWFNVTGSTITNEMVFPVNSTDPTVFFRMVYP